VTERLTPDQPKTALQINKTDSWATHAKVHVLEMEGRTQEGISFLESTVEDWKGGSGLACHNFWHLGFLSLLFFPHLTVA